MKLNLLLKWIALLAVGLGATLASAEQDQVLKTQKDRQSYAMGVGVVRNFKLQGIDFDVDSFISGMKDALAGHKLLLTEEDITTSLKSLSSALLREKVQARIMAGQENKKKGEAFLSENKTRANVVTLPSGLQYKVLKAGDGRKPTEADTVECRYRGTHIDGTEFENSGERPGTLKVSEVIPGWREALKLMAAGSKWLLFIPSQLGYGQQGSGRIGPYETLIFEIELVDVK
jgi:FKBP-type peptidyl-prolyl cis-trans isomerase